MKMKKMLSLAVAGCMAVSLLAMSADAANTETVAKEIDPEQMEIMETPYYATLVSETPAENDITRSVKQYQIYLAENGDTQILAEGVQLSEGTDVKITSTLSPTSCRLKIELQLYNGSSYQTIQSYTNYRSGNSISLYAAWNGQYRIKITGSNSATPITGVMNIDM